VFPRFVHVFGENEIKARHSGHSIVFDPNKITEVGTGERNSTIKVEHNQTCMFEGHVAALTREWSRLELLLLCGFEYQLTHALCASARA
jgi:hypothetical protein